MSPEEQKTLTEEIASHAAAHVKKMIDEGKIPQEWDGIELRWYLEDRIAWHYDDKKRKRAYNNTVMTNGL